MIHHLGLPPHPSDSSLPGLLAHHDELVIHHVALWVFLPPQAVPFRVAASREALWACHRAL